MQALCVVSPEWVKAAGDLHDPDNPRNRALFDQAKSWAESWAGKGSVFGARLDLDEAGGAVVDLMISPVRTSRGKPVISTQKALVELKAATGERNEYSALQTSWADWSREHLDSQIERGTRRTITDRQHLTPETYGLVKDKARAEALQERDQASEVVRALHSASGMAPEAIDELRDLLLLQREIQAHKRDPKQYEPPMTEYLMEGRTSVALDLSPDSDPWPYIDRTRRDAVRVVEAGRRFGLGQDDDKKGYKAGQDFFPALIDRMHLTAVLAKCGEFCARAEAFVKIPSRSCVASIKAPFWIRTSSGRKMRAPPSCAAGSTWKSAPLLLKLNGNQKSSAKGHNQPQSPSESGNGIAISNSDLLSKFCRSQRCNLA